MEAVDGEREHGINLSTIRHLGFLNYRTFSNVWQNQSENGVVTVFEFLFLESFFSLFLKYAGWSIKRPVVVIPENQKNGKKHQSKLYTIKKKNLRFQKWYGIAEFS